jgi:hypothetical protein
MHHAIAGSLVAAALDGGDLSFSDEKVVKAVNLMQILGTDGFIRQFFCRGNVTFFIKRTKSS